MTERIDESVWQPEVLPTRERLAKRDVDVIHSERGGLTVRSRNLNDILMYYARNGFITYLQRRAGCKFQSLFFLSGMKSQYVTSKYSEVKGGSPLAMEEVQEEYRLAREAIRGSKQKKVAFEVCCIGEKAGSRDESGMVTRNMEYLRYALDDLVKHFGYEETGLRR